MGDRFYTQQKNHKPGRRLKKDVVINLERMLGKEVAGLDRLTIKTLDELTSVVVLLRSKNKFGQTYKELAK